MARLARFGAGYRFQRRSIAQMRSSHNLRQGKFVPGTRQIKTFGEYGMEPQRLPAFLWNRAATVKVPTPGRFGLSRPEYWTRLGASFFVCPS